jgi:hypothetical protein
MCSYSKRIFSPVISIHSTKHSVIHKHSIETGADISSNNTISIKKSVKNKHTHIYILKSQRDPGLRCESIEKNQIANPYSIGGASRRTPNPSH